MVYSSFVNIEKKKNWKFDLVIKHSMRKTFITVSDEDTQMLGEEFVSRLKPKDVLLLFGELGSGKTTFVKGIARGLGIKTRIISPTYIVLRTHATNSSLIKKIFHLDLYRLKTPQDIKNIALKDLFSDDEAITIIEWPEIAGDLKNENIYKIYFEYRTDNSRKIEIINE